MCAGAGARGSRLARERHYSHPESCTYCEGEFPQNLEANEICGEGIAWAVVGKKALNIPNAKVYTCSKSNSLEFPCQVFYPRVRASNDKQCREESAVNSVRTFAEISRLFGDNQAHILGKWFLLPEAELITNLGRQFAPKDGKRPVVFVKSNGPNSIVYPRSASVGTGLQHAAHAHLDPGCKCKKNGFVPLNCSITVRSSVLSEKTFSCFEPQGSPLITELGKVGVK